MSPFLATKHCIPMYHVKIIYAFDGIVLFLATDSVMLIFCLSLSCGFSISVLAHHKYLHLPFILISLLHCFINSLYRIYVSSYAMKKQFHTMFHLCPLFIWTFHSSLNSMKLFSNILKT